MKTERIAQHGDEDGDEGAAFPPVYPLFPDAPLGSIDYLLAQRVLDDSAARPGADKRVRYKVWPERFDPITTDEVTIAECCGGGTYDIRAVGAKGRTVGGMRLELEGPAREYSAPSEARDGQSATRESPRPPAAVEQAAPGVLAVRGLDPNVQAVLAMMQANNERAEKQLEAQRLAMQQEAQRVREDAKMMNETMVRMVEATVKGSAPPAPQAPMDQQLVLRMLDRMDRQREREEDRAERKRRRDERDGREEGEGFEVLIEKVPALLSAFPALQQKLGEAMAPMMKDSAKEIVAGVLNEMAGKAG
ncbi:MAG: hypothetical protein U0269_37715 [Polyangiales bacterium]